MRFDSVAWGILKRKVLAWLRLKFGTKPLPIPKLSSPVRIWAGVDTDREETDYLRNTTAFWGDYPLWTSSVTRLSRGAIPAICRKQKYGKASWVRHGERRSPICGSFRVGV